jgi:hypothetical protein
MVKRLLCECELIHGQTNVDERFAFAEGRSTEWYVIVASKRQLLDVRPLKETIPIN